MTEAQELEGWLGRYAAPLLLFVRQHVGSHNDAEDVVQEAFLRFWISRGKAVDPAAYLYGCARQCALDHRRQGRRRERREKVATDGGGFGTGTAGLFAAIEHDERRQMIEAALQLLPAEQREVVVMKIWGGLSFPQIAAVMDVPSDTAASRYRYGLEKLATSLKQEAEA